MSELGEKERSHLPRRTGGEFGLSSGGEPAVTDLSPCVMR